MFENLYNAQVKNKPKTGAYSAVRNLAPTDQKHFSTNNEPSLSELEVMIVDDILSNRKILEYTLRKLGIQKITTCTSGQEAIDSVAEKDFDLILMDLHMPEMSGFDATKEITKMKNGQRPWIVAQTADETSNSRLRTDEIGFDGYLTKPIRPQKVSDCIESLLASSL